MTHLIKLRPSKTLGPPGWKLEFLRLKRIEKYAMKLSKSAAIRKLREGKKPSGAQMEYLLFLAERCGSDVPVVFMCAMKSRNFSLVGEYCNSQISVKDLAKKYHLHESRVRQIIAKENRALNGGITIARRTSMWNHRRK